MTAGLKVVEHQRKASGAGAPKLCLVLSTRDRASGSSSDLSFESEYESNNDNNVSQDEWDQAYRTRRTEARNTSGDGVVTSDEFNAAARGRRGGGRRQVVAGAIDCAGASRSSASATAPLQCWSLRIEVDDHVGLVPDPKPKTLERRRTAKESVP